MLLLAGSHHNLYLKNIRIVEIILELLLAPDCPLPPPLIISRLVWLIEQLGEHGRGQRGACDLNIRRVGLLTLHPPPLGLVSSLVSVLHYHQSAHHWHVNMTPFTYNHTLTLYFEYLEFKDLFLILLIFVRRRRTYTYRSYLPNVVCPSVSDNVENSCPPSFAGLYNVQKMY